MADVSRQIRIRLSDDDIREAVVNWLNERFSQEGMPHWEANHIGMSCAVNLTGGRIVVEATHG